MKEEVISKIKEQVGNERVNEYNENLCPDQLVAVVKSKQRKLCFVGKCRTKYNVNMPCDDDVVICERIDADKIKSNNNLIVIVLESPHKAEFNNNGTANGPAYGETGRRINAYLPIIFSNAIGNGVLSFKDGLYDVILLNAVKKMCSLGDLPQKYRDVMFLKEWEREDTRNCFCARLNGVLAKYKGKEIIVVNCCTKGYHDKTVVGVEGGIDEKFIVDIEVDIKDADSYKLNGLVSKEIEKCKVPFYVCTHPSSWKVPNIKKAQ